ncbi:MAG: translation initiation factor IF-2 [Sphingobacteriales bacterium]|jgi:translation initiation factor IF-2
MSETDKQIRISKVAKELNIGLSTITDHLAKKGFEVDAKPTAKITDKMYKVLLDEFEKDKNLKEKSEKINIGNVRREDVSIKEAEEKKSAEKEEAQEEILIQNVAPSAPAAPKAAPVKEELKEEPKKETPKPVEPKVEAPKAEPKEEPKKADPVAEVEKDAPKTEVKAVAKEEPKAEAKPEPREKPKAEVKKEEPKAETPKEEVKKEEPKVEESKGGLKVLGKIELPSKQHKGKKKEVPKAVSKPAPKVEDKKEEPKAKEPKAEAPKAVETQKVEAPKAGTPKSDVKPEVPKEAPKAKAKKEELKKEEPTVDDKPKEIEVVRARAGKLEGPKVMGKIELPEKRKSKPVASSHKPLADKKRKRKRKPTPGGAPGTGTPNTSAGNRSGDSRSSSGGGQRGGPPARGRRVPKAELTDKQIQEQIKQTLARLSGGGKQNKQANRSKYRRAKRDEKAEMADIEMELEAHETKKIKVTEFVTVNELATLMEANPGEIIGTCMGLGIIVSINQRLDAETLTIVADEFGYEVEFVSADVQEAIEEIEDDPKDLRDRAPIVTVMGHVDHGKTSLLDYVRSANVIGGEAGGITQHIGAYEVTLDSGKKITFLDTPGHEAFTAMRARGAQVTDLCVIVIAADDAVMPQTIEAINHAQAAGVPMVFAINKVDRDTANPQKIREQLAELNILVEDWGGKFQVQEISAKFGTNIDELLEKVLLEAELLELQANPSRKAQGTVVEAMLDKGRGIVTTILVQTGTLRVGDAILAGCHSGKVKAMFNERGKQIIEAGPSTPVQVLGMNGAPQAGDKFHEMDTEQEAKEIANKRLQLQREQGIRTQKHITLDEIGRRLAVGNFKELNLIIKGDVDGSVEALSDSLLKLSTEEIQINVIHKSVGQISESDVLLATASDAIIIGFQVRPSPSARKLAEKEEIDIRLYSIIYQAIDELKQAMEGMLSPEIQEKIVANVEIRDVFKITRVGTVAGCMVLDGKIRRDHKIRIIREGVVKYSGEIGALKRFKDDVKEVATGYECGLSIKNYNDLKVGDIVEAYEEVEVKRKL